MTPTSPFKQVSDDAEMVASETGIEVYSKSAYDALFIEFKDIDNWIEALKEFKNEYLTRQSTRNHR